MNHLLAQGSDLFGRLFSFTDVFPAWAILAALVFLVATAQLALSRHVFWLIPSYLFLCMFSGHSIEQLDTATTLLRWWIIVCFSIGSLNINSNPGMICKMLGLYSIFSMLSVLWSPVFSFAIQQAVLSVLLTLVASRTISGILSSTTAVKKALNAYCLVSIVFIINGLFGIGDISGSRFSGALNAVGLFVITGGLLMPALLWAFLNKKGYYRIAAVVALAMVFGVCVLSGQRTGLFAGAISCLPLIFQLDSKLFLRGFVVFSCVIIFSVFAVQQFPKQSEFISKRYFSSTEQGRGFNTNTTGRIERWETAVKKIMENPVLGHGARADKKIGFGIHNVYLQEWYNGGIIGLVLFLGATLTAFVKTFRLTQVQALDFESKQISRLLFSWTVVLFLSGLFESKLSSPSNLLIFTLVLVGIITHRLELHAFSILKNRGYYPSS